MAYTWQAPPSFAPSESLPAAKLNTIANDLNYLKGQLDSSGGGGGSVELKSSGGAQGALQATLGGVYVIAGYVTFSPGSGWCSYTCSGWFHDAKPRDGSNQVGCSGANVGRLSAGSSVTASATPSGGIVAGRFAIARIGA